MTATDYDTDTDWRRAGACLTADPDLFFPVSPTGLGSRQIARARRVCRRCPVRRQCLEWAISNRQAHGIWGGTTPEERLGKIRARARRSVRRAGALAGKEGSGGA